MMKRMYRVALMLGLVAASAVSVEAAESYGPDDEIAADDFRIKIFPNSPVWAPAGDDFGVKTNVLDFDRDRQVTVWLEADLSGSFVEIDRG